MKPKQPLGPPMMLGNMQSQSLSGFDFYQAVKTTRARARALSTPKS